MGIFSKYTRAYKVTELPSTNIDKEALYIVSDGGKDLTFYVAVRNMNNDQWHILEGLALGTTADTAAAGDHTHPELHTHSNKSTLDGITPAKVTGWEDVADAFFSGKLMSSGFENANYNPTVSPNPFVLVKNTDNSVGLIPLDDIFDTTLQQLIDDSILEHPNGDLELDFTGTNYVHWVFPSGYIEDDGGSFFINAKDTVLEGGEGGLMLNNIGNFFNDKNTSPKGIQYQDDYSATYSNRSLVDKEYVDTKITEVGHKKTFIGSYGTPHTSDINIDTTQFSVGDEWIITYQGTNLPNVVLDGSKKQKLVDVGVDFQAGVKSRIYLHLVEIFGSDYYFDITVTPIALLP